MTALFQAPAHPAHKAIHLVLWIRPLASAGVQAEHAPPYIVFESPMAADSGLPADKNEAQIFTGARLSTQHEALSHITGVRRHGMQTWS